MPRSTVSNSFGSSSSARDPGSSVTLTGSSQELVPAHPGRVALYVTAPAASITLRLGAGSVSAGVGLVVAANATVKIDGYSGAVQVIGTAAQVVGLADV